MMRNTIPTMMTAVSLPVTWTGWELYLHGATTVVGFLTSLCGLGIGVLSLAWWLRKLWRYLR